MRNLKHFFHSKNGKIMAWLCILMVAVLVFVLNIGVKFIYRKNNVEDNQIEVGSIDYSSKANNDAVDNSQEVKVSSISYQTLLSEDYQINEENNTISFNPEKEVVSFVLSDNPDGPTENDIWHEVKEKKEIKIEDIEINKKFIYYKAGAYTVTLNKNGGSGGTGSVQVENGSNMPYINTPSRSGLNFVGYFDTQEEQGGIQYYSRAGESTRKYDKTSNTTLYARWAKSEYTINFDGNGSTGGTTNSMGAIFGDSYRLPENGFYRNNYEFLNWNTRADGSGVSYENRENVDIATTSGSITLYAQWAASTYTISFDGNGNTGGNTSDMTDLHYPSPRYSLKYNSFTKRGFMFVCWNTKADGSGTDYNEGQQVSFGTTTGSVILYAKWEPLIYTITLDDNGATTPGTSKIFEHYEVGFYLDSQLTQKMTSSQNGIIVPQKSYTVTYNYNGGQNVTGISSDTSLHNFLGYSRNGNSNNIYIRENGKIIDLNNTEFNENSTLYAVWNQEPIHLRSAEKEGYNFLGWFTKADNTGDYIGKTDNTFKPNSSTTLYAHYEPIVYHIIFNGNGSSSGTMSSIEALYDSTYTLTANSFVRTGYTFAGWNTRSDGKGTSYSNQQSIKNLRTVER